MLWRVVVERARVGAEKRDRKATLVVAADDLEGAFARVKALLDIAPAGFRIVSAVASKGDVEVLDGHRDLCGGDVVYAGYPQSDEEVR